MEIKIRGPFRFNELIEENVKMKFQVGSIIECINPDSWKGKQKAKVLEIDTEDYNDLCIQWEDGDIQWADSIFFQLVSNPTPKSLLKDGVIATFRDSTRAILHDGDFIYKGKRGNHHIYSRVINYDGNLNAVADIDVMEYDIMKLEFDGKVIWERPLIDYDTLLDNIHEYLNTTTEVDGKVDYLKIKQLIADFEKEWGLE